MNQNDGGGLASGLADDSPIDEVDERLVAYLDGELEPEDRKQLEIELGRSGELRARLLTLQDGWEMLDDLPMATPSPVLLESTLRMAATEATWNSRAKTPAEQGTWGAVKRWLQSKTAALLLLAVIGFAAGAVAVRVTSYLRFQNQLRQLPIALHIDAYLQGSDLELMRSLMQMPEWKQATKIAEQFGEWDFSLQQKIDQATPKQRQQILPELPIERQQQVTEAWQRFEQLPAPEKQTILSVAARVEEQSDAEQLLATMDRYARWRQSLLPLERDQIADADPPQRTAVIAAALQKSTRQWTQQTARVLSDEDSQRIYKALHWLAQKRVNSLQLDEATMPDQLKKFAMKDQGLHPWEEAGLLRRIFWPQEPGAPYNMFAPSFRSIRPQIEQMQGPLEGDELWLIETVLSPQSADFVDAAATIEGLREEVLRIWAEEVVRRMSWRRSGTTLSERYQLIDPSRRDQLDLLEPDEILKRLQDEGRGRR